MLFRIAEIHFFYQGWYDPVYAYLMNGLTFALGSNDIGHTDHPGTPLQIFIALFIKVISLMRGSNDLATDVLTHPESYLRIISIALITINCVLLWLLGLFAFKNLKNRNLAVAMQLFPLLSFQLINFLPVVACESVITLSSIAIAACIILYETRNEGRLKLLIVIALLSALSVSTKISSLSILIVPFIFFEKIKSKTIYLLLSLVFIFLFISPVIGKLGNFTGFIEKLATHTGKYGSGEAKLFDATIFFRAMKQMLLQEFPFTLHLFLLPVGWVVIRKQNLTGSLQRLYLAITLATVFQVLIVARHYGFHYLMPAFALFMPLHGYFWIQVFREKIGAVSTRIASLIVILLVVGVFTRLIIMNKFEKGITNPVEKTSQAVKSEWKGKYIILTDNNNGAAFIEPATRFGFGYSGNSMKKQYARILASAYPGNYLWNTRDGYSDWTATYLSSDIFSMNSKIYLYANTGNCEVSMSKITEIVDQVGMSEFVKLKKVYQNEKSGEVIALAMADTAKIIKNNQSRLVIETSMEELTADEENIKSNNEEFIFRGGKLRSNRYARSGNSSILLTNSNQFGLNFSIPVSKGRRYKVEFWQRSSDQKQTLAVASASKSEIFYKASNQGFNNPGEWTRSELNVSLPENYPETSLQFYLWNPASDSVWVDDFRVTVFE
ncbi:MAG TPA: carbohydrate binding domain-containing protein [Prolixibacteraceae bacterium]